ncbi:MAG: SGNH/GDSL hydrolase family protein, partial [Lachnospiraceae bacterium]
TAELNYNILTDKEVLDILNKAELITITIGSNDLMDEFKDVCQKILNRTEKFHQLDDAMTMLNEEVQKHPTLVFAVLTTLNEWDYEEFEEEWKQTMEIINYHKRDATPIIVTNIYNPTGGLDLPESMNKVVIRVINKMNQIIEQNAKVYHYKIADLSHLGVEEYVQQDGLHPDQKGQQLIADAVIATLMEPVKAKSGKEEKHMEAWSVACIGITGIILLILGLHKDQEKHE